jgi:uncharacterized protein
MPYRTTVRGLSDALASSRTVVGELDMADVELGGQPFHLDGPVTFEVILTNAGTGIVVQGRATAKVLTPCSRCLCDSHLTVEAEVEGFYVRPGHEADLPEEQEAELIADDSSIDLEPAISSAVVVELPYAPVHAEDCKGICPSCGADLNAGRCECPEPPSGSPFAVLRDLPLEQSADS